MAVTDDMLMDEILANQIPEAETQAPVQEAKPEPAKAPVEQPKQESTQEVQPKNDNPLAGQKLSYKPGDKSMLISEEEKEYSRQVDEEKHISKAGDNIFKNAEIREGWIPVDKQLMGLRAYFYPEDWQFRIRPATVEAIRNWSNLNEDNIVAMDDVFNEVLKSCVSIVSSEGLIPWGNINSWDRFYFLLLIREFTFVHGENALKYTEDCPECDNPVEFNLTSNALLYEYPDEDLIKYYNTDLRCWEIDPEEYDVHEEPIRLFLPTLEKNNNIKAWLIDKYQGNPNKKFDQTFMRFLPWMSPKISKDLDIAKKQIRELENKYKSWDIEMFTFMDEVLKNISVEPKDKLVAKCGVCGEEMTAAIRFPRSVADLFHVQNKHRKFGSK